MSRLNLDIFGNATSSEKKIERATVTKAADRVINNQSHKPVESSDIHDTAGPKKSMDTQVPPRFIPVGFLPEHLNLLDEAILTLRKKGYYKASKSAIIRRLIERHAQELADIYLDKNKEGAAH